MRRGVLKSYRSNGEASKSISKQAAAWRRRQRHDGEAAHRGISSVEAKEAVIMVSST